MIKPTMVAPLGSLESCTTDVDLDGFLILFSRFKNAPEFLARQISIFIPRPKDGFAEDWGLEKLVV